MPAETSEAAGQNSQPRSRIAGIRTAKHAVRSGALWGLVFGLYVVASASGYSSLYKTAASRASVARLFGTNTGVAAMIGPAHHLETVAGFTSWRTVGVLTIVGAVWGLLIGTRLLRGEEDAGRWELLLSGNTTRGAAAAQAVLGLVAGIAALWAVTAAISVADGRSATVGFSTTAAIFLAAATTAGAAVFVGVGALAGQLASTRRQANVIGAAVLGASYLMRMVADSGSGVDWLRWISPLGWPEDLQPLIGSRPIALLPIAVTLGVLLGTAIWVASARDLGAGWLPSHDAPRSRLDLLDSATGLATRLTRWVAIAWIAGLAVLGLVLGLVAQSAAAAISGSSAIEKALARLGGHRGGAAAYVGFALILAAGLVAFAAAAQISATRSEEAEGHLDHLLARSVSRRSWMAGRLLIAAAIVLVASAATGLATWVGAASQHSGLGLGELTLAGLNVAPPALFVLGIGALTFGCWPRGASIITYGLVAWSFLVEFIASVIKNPRWLLDSSVLSHITPAPAADPSWTGAVWLIGLGLLAATVGVLAFERRDLTGE